MYVQYYDVIKIMSMIYCMYTETYTVVQMRTFLPYIGKKACPSSDRAMWETTLYLGYVGTGWQMAQLFG